MIGIVNFPLSLWFKLKVACSRVALRSEGQDSVNEEKTPRPQFPFLLIWNHFRYLLLHLFMFFFFLSIYYLSFIVSRFEIFDVLFLVAFSVLHHTVKDSATRSYFYL